MNYNENADNDSNCRDAIILIAMVPPISRVHFFMIISTFFFFFFVSIELFDQLHSAPIVCALERQTIIRPL